MNALIITTILSCLVAFAGHAQSRAATEQYVTREIESAIAPLEVHTNNADIHLTTEQAVRIAAAVTNEPSRISSANQIIDADGNVYSIAYTEDVSAGWSVVIPQPITIRGEIIQPSTNRWPGIPYPLWTDSALSFTQFVTNYPSGSAQPMVVWYYYRQGYASPHEVYFSSPLEDSDAHWFSNYSSWEATNTFRYLLGQDDVSGAFSSSIYMIYSTNTTTIVSTQLVDRVALDSELDTGDYVVRCAGTATNLSLAGTATLNGVPISASPTLVRDGVLYRQVWDANLMTTAWEPIE